MNHIHPSRWLFGLLTIFALASWTQSQEAPEKKPDAPPEPIEVLKRGPIHEAFAAPIIQQPTAPTPIAKQPPPPIKEEPPKERPDLDNAQWIPGYWAWDAERQDYLWVTGVQRAAPQGRTYIPGYWENSAQGYRWIAGFWSNGNVKDLTYAPEPPAPLANREPGQAPNENATYIPGSWVYSNNRFIWREGYWTAAQNGRVWVPSQYVWTPNGYAFVDGYWDVPYDARGVAYAPLYFNQPLWQDPNWSLQPNYIVNSDAFFDSAFVNGNSFYFGNYYNPLYARLGFSPWYAGNGRYDPMFSYHGWQNHRNNPNWIAGTHQLYAQRSAGHGTAANKSMPVSTPAQFHSNNFRLAQSTPTQINAQRTQGQQIRDLSANRQRIETAASKQVSLSVGPSRTLNPSSAPTHTTKQPIWQNVHPSAQSSARTVTPLHTNPPVIYNHAPAQQQSRIIMSQGATHIQSAPHAPQVSRAAPIQHAAPVQRAAPIQHAAPVQRAAPIQHAAPVQRAAPIQHAAPVHRAAPIQHAAPVHRAAPIQHAAPAHHAAPAAHGGGHRR